MRRTGANRRAVVNWSLFQLLRRHWQRLFVGGGRCRRLADVDAQVREQYALATLAVLDAADSFEPLRRIIVDGFDVVAFNTSAAAAVAKVAGHSVDVETTTPRNYDQEK